MDESSVLEEAPRDALRAAWPGVEVDAEVFRRYLAERGTDAGAPHAADLYLACACAHGAPRAAEVFDWAFTSTMARALRRVDPSDAFIDDAVQVVRVKLLVAAEGSPPRIVEYAGRSSLRSWLSVVAARTGFSLRRRTDHREHAPLPDGVQLAVEGSGLETGYLRARYKAEFESAVRVALERLGVRERMLLRLHFADGRTVDELGAFYRVGRSTAARWLAAAREALRDGAARELHERLAVTPSEYESLAMLLRSQLEVSLGALFDGEAAGS